MLFNSAIFIYVFLPIALVGYYGLIAFALHRAAIAWLVLESAVFYAWFSVRYLLLLTVLILFNFAIGRLLSRDFEAGRQRPAMMAFGLVVNLAVLGYFKYANFFIDNLNTLTGTNFVLLNILLPMGISFFTFQKIAYLVDAYRGETEEHDLLDFSLFVMYFPQLIAGPIVHHKEIIPQFRDTALGRFKPDVFAAGLALFTIGLIKKVMIADALVAWSDPIFAGAQAGHIPDLYSAWTGVLAFTLRIYFDFSGYTDMALGLALMFGIRFPLNFDSPYKATNIVDFWRRWHMSLSRFLRDYVYIPLGGNRHGPRRRIINLMLTMLIGGLWHGAAWTFVVWGGLHGLFLIINHGWCRLGGAIPLPWRGKAAGRFTAKSITLLVVMVAWVFFRAETFSGAVAMLKGMAGVGGWTMPTDMASYGDMFAAVFSQFGIKAKPGWLTVPLGGGILATLLAAVLFLPNSQELLAGLRPCLSKVRPSQLGKSLGRFAMGRPIFAGDGTIHINRVTGFAFACLFLAAMIAQSMRTTSLQAFIYFQF